MSLSTVFVLREKLSGLLGEMPKRNTSSRQTDACSTVVSGQSSPPEEASVVNPALQKEELRLVFWRAYQCWPDFREASSMHLSCKRQQGRGSRYDFLCLMQSL